MSKIFQILEGRIGFVYMDDLICFSEEFEENIRRLIIFAECCRQYGLKMRADKCSFLNPSVGFFGHKISGEGQTVYLNRHKALFEMKPTNIK